MTWLYFNLLATKKKLMGLYDSHIIQFKLRTVMKYSGFFKGDRNPNDKYDL